MLLQYQYDQYFFKFSEGDMLKTHLLVTELIQCLMCMLEVLE
jgi:hypothetical protein